MTTTKVKGMTCGGCAASITRAINAADPGARVEVDLEGHAVRVEGEGEAASIKSAIQRAGYEVVA